MHLGKDATDGPSKEEDGAIILTMANRIGASREMVCRIFKDLVKGGYITSQQSETVINKRLPLRY